jgi:hypothetical protein
VIEEDLPPEPASVNVTRRSGARLTPFERPKDARSCSHRPSPDPIVLRPVVLPDTAWLRHAFASLVGQVGPETDQLILRARASGERWVASVRLFLVVGISALVLAVTPAQRGMGLMLLLAVGLLHALLLAWLAFRVAEPWVPWLSCAADVALTSAALVFVLRHGGAGAEMHTRSFYELYFLVIMSAGLRYDWRLCLWTAGLCILAHALTLWVAGGPLELELPERTGSSWPRSPSERSGFA